MKAFVIAISVFFASASVSSAYERLAAASSTCDQAKTIISRDGAVVLRWKSSRIAGLSLYTAFVRNTSQCPSDQNATPMLIGTSNGEICPLYTCTWRQSSRN